MKQTSNKAKIRLRLAVAAIVSGAIVTSISLSPTADSATRRYYSHQPHPSSYSNTGLHLARLPDGGLAGPIAPDANGGG